MLMKYSYPGNIRELQNIVEQSVVLARGNLIERHCLPASVREKPLETTSVSDQGTFAEKVAAFEQNLIRTALAETDGVQRQAASLLGMTERHLRYKLQKYGMKSNRDSE